jgi:TonB family protein
MEPKLLPPSDVELNLLLEWPRRTRPQWTAILSASVALHFLVFLAWLQIPSLVGHRRPEPQVVERRIPLYFPKERMTQKAPNQEKVTKQIELADLEANRSGPASRRGQNTPSRRRFEVPRQLASAKQQVQSSVPPAPAIAAANQNSATVPGLPGGLPRTVPQPPVPQPGPFQNLGDATPPKPNPRPQLAPPKADLNAPNPAVSQNGNSPRLAISDDAAAGTPDAGTGGPALSEHSAVELESDPSGADFKAYLRTILGIVRTNWRRVIPESARMGSLRGRTVVEFIIARDGSIPKLVTADSSGSESLDRAAVVGLSMSNPLPPLPADYKGMQVRLAFTFAYNLPAR